jgi:hypothetical protein
MPPVTDQGNSDWCFAHVAASLLEQFLHQETGLPYTPQTLLSPIDLAEEGSLYLNKNAPGQTSAADSADFNGRQDPIDILLRVQDQGAGRSLAQLTALTSDEAAADRAFSRLLVPKQDQANLPTRLFAPHLSPMNLLFNWETLRDWMGGDFTRTTLEHYPQIVSIAGPPDLALTGFLINRRTTRDPVTAMSTLGQLLRQGRPVAVFFRGQDVPGDWKPFNPGETHIMILVGAGYAGGLPVVRLRNSWSARWGEAGYITSPARDFLKWQRNAAESWRGGYMLTWISAPPPDPPPGVSPGKLVRLEDDFSVFTGSMQDQIQHTRGADFHHYRYITGTRAYSNGRVEVYRDGKRLPP